MSPVSHHYVEIPISTLTQSCRRVAWSTNNCVASIAADGSGVDLRTLVRKPGEGEWVLSQAVPLKVPPLHDESHVVHLSWSSLGSELLVVDAAGHVLIYTNLYALGNMQLTKASNADQDDELNAVIGIHWLPVFPVHQRVGDEIPLLRKYANQLSSVLTVSKCDP